MSIVTVLYAQKRTTGMKIDNQRYSKIKRTAPMTKGVYDALPVSSSLEKYAPKPGDQGYFGTCVGWSTGYAARTILYAKSKKLTDKDEITKNAFSASYIYNQLKEKEDLQCANGIFIDQAMQLIVDKGSAVLNDYSYQCDTIVNEDIVKKALSYKTRDYKKLFNTKSTQDEKVLAVKKAIVEGQPVVIGFNIPDSFFDSGVIWKPDSLDNPEHMYQGHAMCVIGYDDLKEGGAFRIMNSWGTGWADSGFVWVKYADFSNYCLYAYEMIALPIENPELAGSLVFKLIDGKDMSAVKKIMTKGYIVVESDIKGSKEEALTAYVMKGIYTSGTKFRFYIKNNKPAYLYALASDSATAAVNKIFPYKEDISPFLGYANSEIAIPSEKAYIKMDEKKGVDYLCIFYSENPLEIDNIVIEMNKLKGSFSEKITTVFGEKLVPFNQVNYNSSEITFSAKLINNMSFVVPLMVQIGHK